MSIEEYEALPEAQRKRLERLFADWHSHMPGPIHNQGGFHKFLRDKCDSPIPFAGMESVLVTDMGKSHFSVRVSADGTLSFTD